MSAIIRALIFVVLLLFAPHLLPAGSARYTESNELTGSLTENATLHLENVNGRITVEGWESDRYEVVITKKSKTESNLDLVDIQQHITDDRLEIIVKLPKKKGVLKWGNIEASVDLTVRVPFNLSKATVKTVNGGLDIEGLTSSVKASTVNGGIVARTLGGEADISSVNGGIQATFAHVTADDRLDFDTVNGSIRIYLPDDLNADVSSSVVNGRVHCDFPIKLDGGGKRSLRGRIGEGGTQITASSVNGSVHLKQS